jgi:hypothetical protein
VGGKLALVAGGLAVAVLAPPSDVVCRWLAARPRRAVAAGLGVGTIAMMVLLGESETYGFMFFRF